MFTVRRILFCGLLSLFGVAKIFPTIPPCILERELLLEIQKNLLTAYKKPTLPMSASWATVLPTPMLLRQQIEFLCLSLALVTAEKKILENLFTCLSTPEAFALLEANREVTLRIRAERDADFCKKELLTQIDKYNALLSRFVLDKHYSQAGAPEKLNFLATLLYEIHKKITLHKSSFGPDAVNVWLATRLVS